MEFRILLDDFRVWQDLSFLINLTSWTISPVRRCLVCATFLPKIDYTECVKYCLILEIHWSGQLIKSPLVLEKFDVLNPFNIDRLVSWCNWCVDCTVIVNWMCSPLILALLQYSGSRARWLILSLHGSLYILIGKWVILVRSDQLGRLIWIDSQIYRSTSVILCHHERRFLCFLPIHLELLLQSSQLAGVLTRLNCCGLAIFYVQSEVLCRLRRIYIVTGPVSSVGCLLLCPHDSLQYLRAAFSCAILILSCCGFLVLSLLLAIKARVLDLCFILARWGSYSDSRGLFLTALC